VKYHTTAHITAISKIITSTWITSQTVQNDRIVRHGCCLMFKLPTVLKDMKAGLKMGVWSP